MLFHRNVQAGLKFYFMMCGLTHSLMQVGYRVEGLLACVTYQLLRRSRYAHSTPQGIKLK